MLIRKVVNEAEEQGGEQERTKKEKIISDLLQPYGQHRDGLAVAIDYIHIDLFNRWKDWDSWILGKILGPC